MRHSEKVVMRNESELDMELTILLILKIIGTTVACIGTSSGIVYFVFQKFANVWSDKYMEKIKAKYQKDINEFQAQLDVQKETAVMYTRHQYEIYSSIWTELYSLKLRADELWNSASTNNLLELSKQLRSTVENIEKKSLYIDDKHYEELAKILYTFSDFKVGKGKLIEFRRMQDVSNDYTAEDLIAENIAMKQEYDLLISTIKSSFRNKLKGGSYFA